MNKNCSLCKFEISQEDKAFKDEGLWAHENCIIGKLERLKQQGMNSQVIDFIIEKFEDDNTKKQKKRWLFLDVNPKTQPF